MFQCRACFRGDSEGELSVEREGKLVSGTLFAPLWGLGSRV